MSTPSDQTVTLPKGTVIKVDGVPYELLTDADVIGGTRVQGKARPIAAPPLISKVD
ncbi:MAG: hypothetical protein ACR2H4_16905 [Pyrinomonadaceae bacterium]